MNTEETPDTYDSTFDTKAHIARVSSLLMECCQNLMQRAAVHDKSKLEEPEKSGFDRCGTKLADIKYGSPEYTATIQTELKETIAHHYAHNRHHPEYHGPAGINGMTLFDVMEMLVDWKAATERMQGGGDIFRSLQINASRFKIGGQLAYIIHNTMVEMAWIERKLPPPIIGNAPAQTPKQDAAATEKPLPEGGGAVAGGSTPPVVPAPAKTDGPEETKA